MQRITQSNLEAVAARINRTVGAPLESYSRGEDGKLHANIGNYHISYAYGGAALHRMANAAGGVNDIFGGHMPKRELYEKMHAFLRGLDAAKGV